MQAPGQYRILICPLDWGLGHATRCIPLIEELRKNGAHVILAADGPQLNLLRTEFPEADWITFPGYRVRYGKKTGAGLSILFSAPRLLYSILKEHFSIKSLIRKYNINGLISDNRYGLWNSKVRTVFITHQLNIIAPPALRFAEPFLRAFTRYFAAKFDECWIPDTKGENNLSGKLSHGYKLPGNAGYIGILSRFSKPSDYKNENNYDIVAMVSGPEPQRTVFENRLLDQLPVKDKKCLLLRGIPGENTITPLRQNLDIAGHLHSERLLSILKIQPVVICRSGYSTLMDLAYTGNKALLVPTPGQTEQEYLASHLAQKGRYFTSNQDKINLRNSITDAENSKAANPFTSTAEYPAFVSSYLNRISKS
ncbi:MAG: glycosyltransferase 28 domain protein [Bacteroidetes bacterium]|nr:MAG: glycosyltransferase 28 domain protein [Bacteroidota bacterium]